MHYFARFQEINEAIELPTTTKIASIGGVRGASGRRHRAELGDSDRCLGRSGGGLSGSCCTGESEDDDESADDVFHDWIPQKLYFSTVDFGGQIR